ncbi:MAG: PorV/PorQ family protein [Melioribacteraceae bacterium]|nr:PorV/PorQ family protein [Melioribacteraceae bacterium]
MRTKHLVKVFYLFTVIIFCSYSNAQNVSKTGTTAANFLEIPVGAPAAGMGGAFVSLANDATALFWNAAGIANLGKTEVILSHTQWIADTKFDFAGVVLPLGEFGTLGFSFTSLSMDDMKVTTIDQPEGTGEFFSAGNLAIGISYSRKLTDRFSIGFTGKYVQEKIWHMTASAFAFDAGTLFRTDLLGGMIIGATISNFGTPLKLEGRDTQYFIRVDETKTGSNDKIPTNISLDEWELPLFFRIGLSTEAVKTENIRVTVALDAIHPNNNYPSLNIGTEFSFKEFLFIRGGYQSLFLDEAEGGISFGAGVNSKMLFTESIVQFDYSYNDFGRLKFVHSFSLSMMF